MRGNGWIQKMLYGIMAVLGIYIIYKTGSILLRSERVQEALDRGNLQRELEDKALQTWIPGYTASVEEYENPSWIAGWMQQVVPVYSYLAEGQTEDDSDFSPEVQIKDDNGVSPESQVKDDSGISPEGQVKDDNGVSLESQVKDDNGVSPEGQVKDDSGVSPEGQVKDDSGVSPEGQVKDDSGVSPEGQVKDDSDVSPEGRIAGGEDIIDEAAREEDAPDYKEAVIELQRSSEPGSAVTKGNSAGDSAPESATGTGDSAPESGTGINESDYTEGADTVSGAEESEEGRAEDREYDRQRETELSMETVLETEEEQEVLSRTVSEEMLAQLEDFDYLLSNYYTVDGGTAADAELLDADRLLGEDLSIEKNPEVPQILIYHTHSQETFADSREGETADTVVGMGEVLAQELREKYGYQVIHDTGTYDLVDGVLDRSAAYDYARAAVEQILADNPTIEVIIDLHRDGVEGQNFVTEINGKPTSMVMFFNGISRDSMDQPITYLQNPYVTQNLAFSLQMELKAREQYPGFTRNIYLKAERFNLHLRPRSLLIEAGTQLNTVEEERNAMIPLADLLNQVLDN